MTCWQTSALRKSLVLTSVLASFSITTLAVPGVSEGQTTELPYRLVLSGPVQAASGSEVTYRVSYERVSQEPGSPTFVFQWTGTAASLLSVAASDGPQPDVRDQVPGQSVRVGPPGNDAGAVDFLLQIDADFTGELRATIYVPGTGVALPAGSVTEVTTAVSAGALSPASAPETGTGGSGGSSRVVEVAAVLTLAASAALLAGLASQRRRLEGRE
jgi:hypothetical protein